MSRLLEVARLPTLPPIQVRRLTLLDLPALAGIAAAIVGVVVLIGWTFDFSVLKSIFPRASTMKPNTAVCFILLGGGVALIARTRIGSRERRVGLAMVLASAAIGVLTGSQYVTGHDLGIDTLLFRGYAPDAGGTVGRMAPLTAVCFALLGCAAFAAARGIATKAVIVLAASAITIASLNVVQFAFDAATPTFLLGYTAMAVNTAAAFIALGFGIMGLLGSSNPFAALGRRSATAGLFRRLIAVSVVVPVLLAWARIEGQAFGLYDTSYGTSLMLVSFVLLIVIALLRAVEWANAQDVRREAAEAERGRFFELSADPMCVMGSEGRFRRINQAWSSAFDYEPSEVVGRSWTEFIHPDDLEPTIAEAQRNLVEGRVSLGHQNRYRHRDGHYVWLEWVSQPSPDGTVAYAVARDVTDRKQDEDRGRRQRRALESRNEALAAKADRDPLTGLHNRRFFDSSIERLQKNWTRRPPGQRAPISVILFDLDHFGEVNKQHGHQVGDAVLRNFARTLRARFRERDLVSRYGGEEFVAILENASSADARRIADGIRVAFGETSIDVGTGTPLKVTVSAGCAELGEDRDVSAALSEADVWLSQAKRSGRNQVVGL